MKIAKGDGDRSGESLKDNSKIDDRMKIDSHGINKRYDLSHYLNYLIIYNSLIKHYYLILIKSFRFYSSLS